jgi:pimeloyl-ACP methyl ester carboxylesterase
MRQAIVIIGGYNSLWPIYLKMARDLEDLTHLQAVGVPLMPWHWWLARRTADASGLLVKLAETVAWARRKLETDRLLLVGHSAGGVLARLYLHDGPVWGRVYRGTEHVGGIVTLGSPHCSEKGTRTGWFLSDQANRLVPGTPYHEEVRYYAIAGERVQGSLEGSYRQRRAFRLYKFFAGQGDVWGDGTVPVSCAALAGAQNLVLAGVVHSRKHGSAWYGGSKSIIRRWWPPELNDAV